jgi:hypothetical protein
MRLRHGAPPSLIQAGARPVSQLPTPVDSALASDVLPYDSKIFRLFSDSVKKRFCRFRSAARTASPSPRRLKAGKVRIVGCTFIESGFVFR